MKRSGKKNGKAGLRLPGFGLGLRFGPGLRLGSGLGLGLGLALGLGIGVLTLPFAANARDAKLPETEAQIMGTLAGAAWACGANSLRDFELIAGNILLNKAKTRKAQEKAIDEYAAAKLSAYRAQKNFPKVSCPTVIARFNEQEIFGATVYADGRVQMPDGTWLIPQKYLNGQEKLSR